MRTASSFVLSLVAGVALVLAMAGLIRRVFSPFRSIGPDAVVLYVGACRFSEATFRNLNASSGEALAAILPVPLAENPHLVPQVCQHVLPRLRQRHWHLGLLPSMLACRWLVDDAGAAYRSLKVDGFPAYVIGDTVMPVGYERPIFAALGLNMTHDGEGGVVFSPAQARTGAHPVLAADDAGRPRYPLGQPAGW